MVRRGELPQGSGLPYLWRSQQGPIVIPSGIAPPGGAIFVCRILADSGAK
jgi:hypothetical protein